MHFHRSKPLKPGGETARHHEDPIRVLVSSPVLDIQVQVKMSLILKTKCNVHYPNGMPGSMALRVALQPTQTKLTSAAIVIINPRCACAARITVVVLCVFASPTEILRMAALGIELSHVLCIKSNYLQNRRVICRKTLSFLRYSQSCSYDRFRLHGHAYKYDHAYYY